MARMLRSIDDEVYVQYGMFTLSGTDLGEGSSPEGYHFVAEILGDDHPLRDDAVLLTSELATNAVEHSGSRSPRKRSTPNPTTRNRPMPNWTTRPTSKRAASERATGPGSSSSRWPSSPMV
ncbi:hypothetical protein [Streptosporangium sp. NPDC002721]|uniref:hypothetical protein n=1 Tax=Streptosporangium sp. NPDC002721 TaxID=3366188 RepID=UPI0036A9E791